MENILRELIQIESSAEARIKEALDKKERLDQMIRDAKAEIEKRAAENTKEESAHMEDKARRETALRIETINAKSQASIAALTKIYDSHHAAWADDLVNQIIGF